MVMDILKRFGIDCWRVAFLLLMSFLLIWGSAEAGLYTGESMMSPLMSSMGAVVAIAFLSHVTRRVLFTRLDMIVFARKALEQPIAAALVFLGVCFVLSSLILAQVMLMS